MGAENSITHSKNNTSCIGSKNKLNKVKDRNTGTRHAGQDETGREGELGGAAFEQNLVSVRSVRQRRRAQWEYRVKGSDPRKLGLEGSWREAKLVPAGQRPRGETEPGGGRYWEISYHKMVYMSEGTGLASLRSRAGSQEGWAEYRAGAETAVLGRDFLAWEASILLLRLFNWLKQVHPDFSG